MHGVTIQVIFFILAKSPFYIHGKNLFQSKTSSNEGTIQNIDEIKSKLKYMIHPELDLLLNSGNLKIVSVEQRDNETGNGYRRNNNEGRKPYKIKFKSKKKAYILKSTGPDKLNNANGKFCPEGCDCVCDSKNIRQSNNTGETTPSTETGDGLTATTDTKSQPTSNIQSENKDKTSTFLLPPNSNKTIGLFEEIMMSLFRTLLTKSQMDMHRIFMEVERQLEGINDQYRLVTSYPKLQRFVSWSLDFMRSFNNVPLDVKKDLLQQLQQPGARHGIFDRVTNIRLDLLNLFFAGDNPEPMEAVVRKLENYGTPNGDTLKNVVENAMTVFYTNSLKAIKEVPMKQNVFDLMTKAALLAQQESKANQGVWTPSPVIKPVEKAGLMERQGRNDAKSKQIFEIMIITPKNTTRHIAMNHRQKPRRVKQGNYKKMRSKVFENTAEAIEEEARSTRINVYGMPRRRNQNDYTTDKIDNHTQSDVYIVDNKEGQRRSDVNTADKKERQRRSDVYTTDNKEGQKRSDVYTTDNKEGQRRSDVYTTDNKEGQRRSDVYTTDNKEGQRRSDVYTTDNKEGQRRSDVYTTDNKAGQRRSDVYTTDNKEGQRRSDVYTTDNNDQRQDSILNAPDSYSDEERLMRNNIDKAFKIFNM